MASAGSLDLGAGTYWLELHAGGSFTDDNGSLEVDWATVGDNSNPVTLVNFSGGLPNIPWDFSGYEQQAFQIDGEPIGSSSSAPEPSAGWLTGAGSVGLLAFLRLGARQRSAASRRIG